MSVVAEKQDELVALVATGELDEAKSEYLIDRFSEIAGIAASADAKAREIVVTDESQVSEMRAARELRLELRAKRIEVEKARKQLKEQALREGQAIDRVAKWLKGLIEPTEQYLDEQEHFVEIKRKAEEEARRIEAEKLLREKEERERKEREEAERREREEMERRRREAEEEAKRERAAREAAEAKARAEREEAERKAAEERRKAEAAARAEREAHEKAIAEERRKAAEEAARARKEAEERAAKERAEAAEKAKREREEYERQLAEVRCPHCGNVFDSRGHSTMKESDHE